MGVGVPITIATLFYLADSSAAIVWWMLKLLIVLAVFISILVVFRDRILKLLFKGATGSFNQVLTSSYELADRVGQGQFREAMIPAKTALGELAAIYTWAVVRFRILALFFALVGSIAFYIQGMLMFRQNTLIEGQNKLVQREQEILATQSQLLQEQAAIQATQQELESVSLRRSLMADTTQILRDVRSEVMEFTASVEPPTAEELEESNAALKGSVGGTWSELVQEKSNEEDAYSFFAATYERMPDSVHINRAEIKSRQALATRSTRMAWEGPSSSHFDPVRLSDQSYQDISTFLELLTRQSSVENVYQSAKGVFALAILRQTFDLAPLRSSDFTYCEIANQRLYQIDFSKLELYGSRFDSVQFDFCRFDNADLSNVVFKNCMFRYCRFNAALLPLSDSLVECEFYQSHLAGAFCTKGSADLYIQSNAEYPAGYSLIALPISEVLGVSRPSTETGRVSRFGQRQRRPADVRLVSHHESLPLKCHDVFVLPDYVSAGELTLILKQPLAQDVLKRSYYGDISASHHVIIGDPQNVIRSGPLPMRTVSQNVYAFLETQIGEKCESIKVLDVCPDHESSFGRMKHLQSHLKCPIQFYVPLGFYRKAAN